MADGQQIDTWAEAGFPNVRFHPIRKAAKALYDALVERTQSNIYDPHDPTVFSRIIQNYTSSTRYYWHSGFDAFLHNIIGNYYNEEKWDGKYTDESMCWIWSDMQKSIADNTEWLLSDRIDGGALFQDNRDMVLPTVNWANARREALQRLKYKLSAGIGFSIKTTHQYRFSSGEVVPSFLEQFALLQQTPGTIQEYIAPFYIEIPSISLVLHSPGVLSSGNGLVIQAELFHSPVLLEENEFGKQILLKYSLTSHVQSLYSSVTRSLDTTWVKDAFYDNKEKHEIRMNADASGKLTYLPSLQDLQLINSEALPQDSIFFYQTTVHDFYYRNNVFFDASTGFIYPSFL